MDFLAVLTLRLDEKFLLLNLEMPFGRDIYVVPSNTVLDRGPSTRWEGGEIRGLDCWNPQFAVTPPTAKLLWPLLLLFSDK